MLLVTFWSMHIFGMNESLYAAGYLSLRHIFGMNESLYADGYLLLRHICWYEWVFVCCWLPFMLRHIFAYE